MKKILKILGIIFLSAIIILGVVAWSVSEELPEGQAGSKADQLAEKMLEAINHKAYQNTSVISWNFAGVHEYEWHKAKDYVIVSFDDKTIQLDLNNYANSKVLIPKSMPQAEQDEWIDDAVKHFNNDSFWLVAPHKVMDENVERKLVTLEDSNALLVTFERGGTTPGDSYLWILDENFRPKAYKMWVSIIPIGGLKAEWNNWVETETGVQMSTTKSILGIPIAIKNLKTED